MDPNNLSITSFDPFQATAPLGNVEGRGIKVGEGTVLLPVFGLETGLITNVFYQQTDAQSAGVLRLLGQIGAGSLGRARLGGDGPEIDKGSFQYRADLRLSYDVILSDNADARDTGGLGAGVNFQGLVNPMGRWSLGLDEDFLRLIRAANFETDANTNRDINTAAIKLLYHPLDRSFGGFLYYSNTIDVFERQEQRFANRMFNRFGVHPTWQWLPKTQVFADISQGIVSPIGGASTKVASYPFAAQLGLTTLFTLKTTFNVSAGYTNGFYSSGPSFSGPLIGAALGYRYSPLGRAVLQYSWQYQDSINANYFRDHVVQLSVQQLFVPFQVIVQPEIHFREYNGITIVDGPPTRNDVIFALVAGLQYNFRDWIAATLSYRLSLDETNYRYMPIGGGPLLDPSYLRNDLLLGMRAAL